MRAVFADPRTDLVFKRIFGAVERKPLLAVSYAVKTAAVRRAPALLEFPRTAARGSGCALARLRLLGRRGPPGQAPPRREELRVYFFLRLDQFSIFSPLKR